MSLEQKSTQSNKIYIMSLNIIDNHSPVPELLPARDATEGLLVKGIKGKKQ